MRRQIQGTTTTQANRVAAARAGAGRTTTTTTAASRTRSSRKAGLDTGLNTTTKTKATQPKTTSTTKKTTTTATTKKQTSTSTRRTTTRAATNAQKEEEKKAEEVKKVEEEKKIETVETEATKEDEAMDNGNEEGEDYGEEEYYDEEDDEQEYLEKAIREQAIDLAKFKIALAKRDLRINGVGSDGNCFFRAVADQLYGQEYHHWNLRQEVCDHLDENKEEYKFYIEDDISIDIYTRVMRRDGIWGGQLEMSVLAKLHKFNVIIHQIDMEDMAQEFHSWDTKGLKVIHLTYHRGRHYNSVRKMTDPGNGPAINHRIKHPLVPKELTPDSVEPEEVKTQVENGAASALMNMVFQVYENAMIDQAIKTSSEEAKRIDMSMEDLIQYTCNLIDVYDCETMEQALNQVFEGRTDQINTERINDEIHLIVDAYFQIYMFNQPVVPNLNGQQPLEDT